jgi:hypothetical protein
MRHSTLKFATAHDQLDFHPAIDFVIAGNWLRHFPQRYPRVANMAEWAFCGTVAATLFVGTLVMGA